MMRIALRRKHDAVIRYLPAAYATMDAKQANKQAA
jgi:hypothetical protein